MPRNPFKTRCSVPGCRAWAIRGSDPPICSPHRSRKNSPEQESCPEPGQGAYPEPGPGACPEPGLGAYTESGHDACPEPERGTYAESGHDACPEPERGACPEPERGACPEPERGACPERKRGVGAPPGNQNHFIHGFYATSLPPDEQARLLAPEGITSLDAEIALTRAALDCIYEMLTTGVTPGPNPQPLDAQDYARFIGLAFRGTNTVARLLSTRMALGGRPTDAFSVTVDKVLDELGAKWGIDL
jgi:hypothetical protein